ncbi:MAG: hypothetical protein IKM62_05395 [Kiritimatiellae bacterium]|nr:hypothetical protein [Kiritimatiellia bacterium]
MACLQVQLRREAFALFAGRACDFATWQTRLRRGVFCFSAAFCVKGLGWHQVYAAKSLRALRPSAAHAAGGGGEGCCPKGAPVRGNVGERAS